MGSAAMVDRMLDAADQLMRSRPRSAAFRRRAVSTAYYAVFHALAKLCAECLLPGGWSKDPQGYAKIYRALDHGPLRAAFGQSPLKDGGKFEEIGTAVVRLQQERHRADDMPPDAVMFPVEEAQQLLAQARRTVSALDALDRSSRLLLSTHLLFRDRRPV
ncbi:hypothetical protein [Aquibium microcysteis]|uniref:hypothetical protein n=1 Tax=Aquibium microcysteis TaxID=675281 RepID=UPI00165D1AE9|nr:hypothetical protein [Aquibium microcysteis]